MAAPLALAPPALLVEQPLATLLAAGVRRLFTLPRYTGHRGEVFLYASAYGADFEAVLDRYPALAAALDERGIGRLPVGHVVGVAELVKVSRIITQRERTLDGGRRRSRTIYPPTDLAPHPLELLASNYSPARFVVELARAQYLAEPVPFERAASADLFQLPDDVLDKIRAQLWKPPSSK